MPPPSRPPWTRRLRAIRSKWRELAPECKLRAGVTWQTVYIAKPLILRGGYTTTNWLTSNPIAYPTVLDAQQAGRVVKVTGGISINVTLENLTVRGGSTTSDFGSGVSNNVTLLLNNMTIVSNASLAEGGGIFNAGTLTVTRQ